MRLDIGVSFCFYSIFFFCFFFFATLLFCCCCWCCFASCDFLLLLFLVVCSCGCVIVAVLLCFSFFWFCFVLFSLYVCIFLRSFLKLSFCQINGNCEIFMGEDQKREVDGKGDFRMKKIHTDKKGQLLSLYWALWRILRA